MKYITVSNENYDFEQVTSHYLVFLTLFLSKSSTYFVSEFIGVWDVGLRLCGMRSHELPLICNHSRLPVLVLKDTTIRSVLIATLGDYCCTEYSKLIFLGRTNWTEQTSLK